MSDHSAIEWTDSTWNPVTGCSKVSQGCKHCYALREWPRLAAPRPRPTVYTGREFTDVQCHPERLQQPLRWRRPRRIFVNSMSDLFHEAVPDAFIDAVLAVMWLAPLHRYQVLTKRPERARRYFAALGKLSAHQWIGRMSPALHTAAAGTNIDLLRVDLDGSWFYPAPPSMQLGVSIEDQPTANARIPELLAIPAAVRFVSYEPALGPVDLTTIPNANRLAEGQRHLNVLGRYAWECSGPEYVDTCNIDTGVDWVIAGGESGHDSRPAHPDWFRSVRDQCAAAKVPFFFKQWGEHVPAELAPHPDYPDSTAAWRLEQAGRRWHDPAESLLPREQVPPVRFSRVGKHAAGRLLDGRTHDEYPR